MQTPPESADAPEGRSGSDPDVLFWHRFAEAKTPKLFCQSWLPLQCRMLDGVKSAMVLLGSPDQGPYSPVAVWPDAKLSMNHLVGTAEKSIRQRQGLVVDAPPASGKGASASQIAYPIEVFEKIHGVVVLEVEAPSRQDVQRLMRQLHWGAAWLEVLIRRTESSQAAETLQRLQSVMDLMVSVVEQDDFSAAAMAFATRMATTLDCDRVSLGFVRRNHVTVAALSHSADFGSQTNLARAIALAMDEAVDQKAVVRHPQPSGEAPLVTRAHEALTRQFGTTSVLTIPLEGKDGPLGALTLERSADAPFDRQTVAFCESAAAFVAPVLALKRKEDRWIVGKIAASVADQLRRLLGPGYLIRKLVVVGLAALVTFFALFRVDYRVTADSIIEGEIKRSIAAPFDGYVKEAPARAGDVVREGQLICLLDDRDLTLERLKWTTEREQLAQQYQEAMAQHERARSQITKAKMAQAQAQMDLLDEQLARTRLSAPFDAVVMSGDLSQALGAPVERGQVLFEVAPLDRYRVIVNVDERDITDIRVDQQSEMLLPSMPGASFPFVVQKITPVTTAKEGRNFFRVEGRIEAATDRLRPGMEGVAKITVDRRRLIWVWTHEAIDWVRLKLWRWMP